MPRPAVDPACQHAHEAVRALAVSRMRAPGATALREGLAAGTVSVDIVVRDAVREWVRSGLRDSGGDGVSDEAYEHLLGLSARGVFDARASGRGEWDLVLERTGGSRGARRSRAGVFYTPSRLVDWVLDAALEPAIADVRERRPGDVDGVLALRVCDPACGSGRFLVAAARRLAGALAADRAAGREPTLDERRAAMRDVVGSCVFGVDIDDIAVQLCRASLGALVEAPAAVGPALAAHIREGDALLGATPEVLAPGEFSRARADEWCGGFFRAEHAAQPQRRFFHWFVEFGGVFGGGGEGRSGAARTSPSLDGLDAHQAFPPPRCGGGFPRRGGGSSGPPSRGGFDVVVGNPPFLNQLQSGTAVDAGVRALLRARFDGAVRGYADTAGAFLLLATQLAAPGGRVGLVLPRSLLAVEHAGRVRAAVLEAATPTALWVAPSGAFAAASVATCAVALHKGGARVGTLRRARGVGVAALAPIDVDVDELASRPSWSHLLADADGIPNVVVRTSRTIGDIADATADFRDQYYGLRGLIIDDPEPHPRRPKLITSGLIAPLESLWGRIPTRIHKKVWQHPRVDLDALDAAARTDPAMRRLAAWAKARLVPKLLLATQTRVLEVLPDPAGELLPCVPVITIVPKAPHAADLERIAAVLSSPAMSAIALTRHAGAGMSADAIKLSAKQVLALPLMDGDDAVGLDAHTLADVGEWWSRRAKRISGDSRPGSARGGGRRAPG